jgi:hypothetical protein
MQAEDGDQRAVKSRIRYTALQTIGNLTILTQALTAAVSNGPWKQKRPELLSHSLLPINLQLRNAEVWDEAAIEKRSNELLKRRRTRLPKARPLPKIWESLTKSTPSTLTPRRLGFL